MQARPVRPPTAQPLGWPGAVGGVILAAVLVVAGASLHATAADRHLFVLVNALGPGAAAGWSALSVLGLGLSGYIVVGLAGPRHARLAAAFLLALLLGGLAVQLTKSIVAAPRPLAVLGAGQVEVIGVALLTRALPSGHGASIAALATLWIVDTAAARGARSACVALVVAAPFAVAVGASRLAVGAHWPADVLVGAGFGVAVATLQSTLAPLVRARESIAGWLEGRAGSRLQSGVLATAGAAAWVAERDYPAADVVYRSLALVALVGAWRWWRLYAGPAAAPAPWRWD